MEENTLVLQWVPKHISSSSRRRGGGAARKKKMERKLLFPAHTFTFLRLPPHVPPVRLHNYYGAAAAAAAAIAASSFRGCPLTYLAM